MDDERFEWIKATVDYEGELSITYQVSGLSTTGRDDHDEDVSDWKDKEIKDLVKRLIGVPDDQADLIEIIWD